MNFSKNNSGLYFLLLALLFSAFIFTNCEKERDILLDSQAFPYQESLNKQQRFTKELEVSDQSGLNKATLKISAGDASQLEKINAATFKIEPLFDAPNLKDVQAEGAQKNSSGLLEPREAMLTVEVVSKSLQENALGFSLDFQDGGGREAALDWIGYIFPSAEKVVVESCEENSFGAVFYHRDCGDTTQVLDVTIENFYLVSVQHNGAKAEMTVFIDGDCYSIDFYSLANCASCNASPNDGIDLATRQKLSSFAASSLSGAGRSIMAHYISNIGELNAILYSDKPEYKTVQNTLREFWQVNKGLIVYGFDDDTETVREENVEITLRLLRELSQVVESPNLKKAIAEVGENLRVMKGKNLRDALKAFDEQALDL